MKVKELMETLQECDQEVDVKLFNKKSIFDDHIGEVAEITDNDKTRTFFVCLIPQDVKEAAELASKIF